MYKGRAAVGNLVSFFEIKRSDVRQVRATIPAATLMRLLSLLLLAFFSLSPVLRAQLYTGSVTGLVTDPSGALVPSAKITLTDQNKGFSFTAATDPATGRYVLRSIPPGTYKITAEAPGFQGQAQDGITLDVSQNITVDFSLRVGTATEVVEVKGAAGQLQTEDAVTGQVVNRRFVNDLPLIDRNFTNLAYLAPGITETDAPGTKNAQGGINFNSNGSRNATADVLIDGASATNFDQNSGIQNVPYTPSVDSVEEFKVQQTNFTAEYGFAAGTIINVVTRSGTNQFHGSAYEFFRNSVMDANEWFNNAGGNKIPAFKRNDFGGTVGGPIRKDKTFFFFNYEGIRESTSAQSGFMGVPSLCERGEGPCPAGKTGLGNFSELCTLQGGAFDNTGMCSNPAGQLWDPYSGTFSQDPATDACLQPQGCIPGASPGSFGSGALRSKFIPFNDLGSYQNCGIPSVVTALNGTPFQLSQTPGCLIDPVAGKLLRLFPKPTVNATDFTTLQGANFFSSGVNTDSNNQFDIKVDHRFSERDFLSVRYSQQKRSFTSFNCFGNFLNPCSSPSGTVGPGFFRNHELAINQTHTFSPTVVLTLTFGYVRRFDNFPGLKGQFPNIDSLFAQVGFPPYLNNGFGTIPQVSISGYSSGNASSNLGPQQFSITREGQDAYHLAGAVSWLRGKHELKFGGEWRARRINHGNPGWPSGFFTFDFTSTSRIATTPDTSTGGGDGLASFLTGVGSPNLSGGGCTPCQQGFNNFVSTQSFQYGTFVQDNYRVTPKLTLNLGLRYELNIPRTERFNRMNWLDPNALSPLQVQGLPTLHGIEVFASPNDRYNYYTDYKNIAPRFGLAYQLPHAFVVRGGYGIYFSTPRSGAAGTGPWGYQGFNIQPPWLTTFNIDHATPWNTLKNTSCLFSTPFTCSVAPPPGNSLGAFNDIGFSAVGPIRSVSQNTAYEQAWSFGFQKQLPGKILVDTTYVGKKGTHLYFGFFREHNYLPPSAIAGLTPAQIGNLTNQVTNPFFFNGSGTCDRTKFICDPTSGLAGPTISAFQLLVPFPQYNSFAGDSPPIANSIYHALQVRVEKQFSAGLQFLMTYSWSKSIDDASTTDDSVVFLGGGFLNTGIALPVQNPFDLRAERSESVFDVPQVWQLSYVYELPVGRGRTFGRNMNSILNAIVGGWQTNGIVRIDSGRPILGILLNTTTFNSASFIPTYGQRPNLSAPLQRASGSPEQASVTNADPNSTVSYFSNASVSTINAGTGALTAPAPFTFGNAPRTISSVRQPGARDVSMSLFKDFPLAMIREGMRLQFRAESFNTFNHPHFGGPDPQVGSSTFGKITSTVNSPRELQLALKLYF
jgi:Carboxypeptidase regulatory-like domain/TonB dependent receptor